MRLGFAKETDIVSKSINIETASSNDFFDYCGGIILRKLRRISNGLSNWR